LLLADYLISQPDPQNFVAAARQHVLTAANLAIQSLTQVDDQTLGSPQLIENALNKFEDPAAKDFAKFYIDFWNTDKKGIKHHKIKEAYYTVKRFLDWVKEYRVEF